MLRSLFVGLSGIQNSQSQMDVISNNIANVNTTGYKKGQITFTTSFFETLRAASSSTNPQQIGSGSSIGSIDTNFNQGMLEQTGMATDMALNGKGFFIVSDGSQDFYTRAGSFQVDSNGNLLSQDGRFNVQGRLADSNGVISSGTSIQDIVLPFGSELPAAATQNFSLNGNLDQNASTIEEWLGNRQLTTDGGMATEITDLNEVVGYSIVPGDTIEISGTDKEGNALSETFVYGQDGKTFGDLIAKVNSLFQSTSTDGATMELDQNGKLRLTANIAGENEFTISFSKSGLHEANSETHSSEAFMSSGSPIGMDSDFANITDIINSTSGNPVGNGDYVTINGTNPDGEAVSFDFTYGLDNDGTTIQDLLNKINEEFQGVSATLNTAGEIVVTDQSAAHSNTSIEFVDGTMSGFEAKQFNTDQFTTSYTEAAGAITGGTALNDIDQVGTDYVADDVIRIVATSASGESISTDFVYGIDGTTVDDLMTKINTIFPGVTAEIEDGQIVIKDTSNSDVNDYTAFSLFDLDSNIGSGLESSLATTAGNDNSIIPLPSFTNIQNGELGTHTANMTVYDSLGNQHQLFLTFTQDPTPGSNKWDWSILVDDGKINPTGGNTGEITFNEDGSLNAFTYDGNAESLTFNVDGTDSMSITIDPGNSGTFDGVTQSASSSTAYAGEQDGYAMGLLSNISIDEQGIIVGNYSNGINNALGQIALANFTNQGGLEKIGGSLFDATTASGSAKIDWAGETTSTSVLSNNLENSNVDLTEEFSKMIIAQRAMEANSKIMSTSDSILTTIISQIKRG